MSVPEDNWNNFISCLNNINYLKNIHFKIAVEDDGRSFYKLTIKIRKKIVADGLSAMNTMLQMLVGICLQ